MINQTIIEFSGGNVPIPEVAKIMKKINNSLESVFKKIGFLSVLHTKKKVHLNIHITFHQKNYMSILDISIRNKNQMCNFNNCTFLFYYFLIYDFGERSGKYEIT